MYQNRSIGNSKSTRACDRTTSELIREAMELYRNQRIRPKRSLLEMQPLALSGGSCGH